MNNPKVEIYKHFKSAQDFREDEWGWRLKAGNGEIVAQGEGHGSPRDAERAFRTVAKVIMTILVGAFEEGWVPYVEVID
jgi:uncharacterized protein YegP (UPF0339 family)